MDIQELLIMALTKKASDLHLSTDLAPLLRIDGELCNADLPKLNEQEILNLLEPMMSRQQRQVFSSQLELDFSFALAHGPRVRVNLFRQFRGLSAVFRIIPETIPTLQALGVPSIVSEIMKLSPGLVLVAGPAGSGKSTTLAALIDNLNENYCYHVITIEDPIEFVHASKNCLISQREVQKHTLHVNKALRAALREDPNVLVIGELRDAQTIRLAMTAAETGHFVLGSLHALSAAKTIHRIIDAFSFEERGRVRAQLAESLQMVVAQTLVKKKEGGRVLACEIMRSTPAIRHLIREDKVAQLYSFIQTGQAQGMQTFEQHLERLAPQLA